MLACPRCEGGCLQRLKVVTRPAEVRAVLESVGLAADSPSLLPSRLSLQADLFDVA